MYSTQLARHYAAYRPPLHAPILARLLNNHRKRRGGLDIGCGCGHSTRALAEYCRQTIGIDPARDMLSEIQQQPTISYIQGSGEALPPGCNNIDIVTLAGSLNYLDHHLLGRELIRVCHSKSEILVYDFDVDLNDIATRLALANPDDPDHYDHQLNLTGTNGFDEIVVGRDELSFCIEPQQLAHLILADSDWNAELHSRHGATEVTGVLQNKIETIAARFTLRAQIYYAAYRLTPVAGDAVEAG